MEQCFPSGQLAGQLKKKKKSSKLPSCDQDSVASEDLAAEGVDLLLRMTEAGRSAAEERLRVGRRLCANDAGGGSNPPKLSPGAEPAKDHLEPRQPRSCGGAGGSCPRRGRWGLLVARGQRQGGERGLRWGCGRKGVVMVTNDWYSPKEARFRFNRGKTQGRRKG